MTTANHTIFLNEVHCKGYEDKLMDCRHKYGDNVCTYDEDVLLTCGEFNSRIYIRSFIILSLIMVTQLQQIP